MWGEPSEADQRELLCRSQNVAHLAIERLKANFPRDDARSSMQCFDIRMARKGFGPLPCADARRYVLRGVRRLTELLSIDAASALLQYNDVIAWML